MGVGIGDKFKSCCVSIFFLLIKMSIFGLVLIVLVIKDFILIWFWLV